MRRLFRLRPLVLLALAGPLLFSALAIPGWRHRHAGTAGHTHSHGGVTHTHDGHTHAHSHAHDGWHVHLSFFGWEVTLWEPGADETTVADAEPEPRNEPPRDGEGPVFVAASPVTAGWISVFLIDPGPLPDSPNAVVHDQEASHLRPTDDRRASRHDAPAVPPPEKV